LGFDGLKFGIWNTRFEQLVEYERTHGNCDVPRNYERNQELASWVHNQLVFNSRKSLPKDHRVAKLESIGFDWDRRTTVWDIRFEQLVEYNQIHGNCAVPTRYEPNEELGCWVVNLRRYLDGTHSMPKDRVAKLESLGFMFADTTTADTTAGHSWDFFFEELRELSWQPIVGELGKEAATRLYSEVWRGPDCNDCQKRGKTQPLRIFVGKKPFTSNLFE
jgi:hypothetical protein